MNNHNQFASAPEFVIKKDISNIGWSSPDFHYHNLYEIYLLINGERTLYVNDDIYQTSSNNVYLLRPYVLHKSSGENPFSGLCIHFSEDYLNLYFSVSAQKQLLNCFNNTLITLNEDDLHEIINISEKMLNSPKWQFAYLGQIFAILNNYTDACDNMDGVLTHGNFAEIMKYITDNFSSITSLKEVASKFYFSPNHFGLLFRKQTGTTFKNYINALRVQYASYRIVQNELSIEEIAQECGFSSPAYFCRVFKKQTTLSPSKYRQKHSNNI